MTDVYAESSAVLRWLLGGDAAVRQSLAEASMVLSSRLTIAEVGRTLRRLAATGAIRPQEARRLWTQFRAASAHWALYEVSAEILSRCAEPFDAEPVRTLDAVHLATVAQHVAEVGEVTVLSTDERMRENARAMGLVSVPG